MPGLSVMTPQSADVPPNPPEEQTSGDELSRPASGSVAHFPPPMSPRTASRLSGLIVSPNSYQNRPRNSSNAGNDFSFQDISFTINPRTKKEKVILQGISGSVGSGEVLAILGPSGAGKTTLLNSLTLDAHSGETRGHCTLNGRKMNQNLFAKHAVVVTQVDHHWSFLTARETISYAADLFLTGVTRKEKEEKVQEMIEKMGLGVCADTIVGNAFLPGLSGGQKRRLSLAVALIKQPQVIFLDEPTSGLDAAAAAHIMEFIKALAYQENLIIVATIHQPSTKVYNYFSQTMLLSCGRVAYYGRSEKAAGYFEGLGHELPGNMNVAEFMLDLVNREFTAGEQVDAILETWDKKKELLFGKAGGEGRNSERGRGESLGGDLATHRFNPIYKQVIYLLRRHGVLVRRDPLLYIGRMAIFFAVTSFFSAIYIKSRDRNQTQVLSRCFLIMWEVGVPSCMGTIVVYAYNSEFFSIRKETKNGMLLPTSYILANFILQLPFMVILSNFALLPVYFFANWNWDKYHFMLVNYSVSLFVFENTAQLLAALIPNPLVGVLLFLNYWFGCFLFAGVLVATKDVVWPLKALCYGMPLRWTLRTMSYLEYNFADFTGATLCNDVNDNTCRFHFDDQGEKILPGWRCEDQLTQQCYGHQGTQVINSLGQYYATISSEDTIWTDVTFNLIIGFSTKLLFFFVLRWQSRRASVVKVPERERVGGDEKMVSMQVEGSGGGEAQAQAQAAGLEANGGASTRRGRPPR